MDGSVPWSPDPGDADIGRQGLGGELQKTDENNVRQVDASQYLTPVSAAFDLSQLIVDETETEANDGKEGEGSGKSFSFCGGIAANDGREGVTTSEVVVNMPQDNNCQEAARVEVETEEGERVQGYLVQGDDGHQYVIPEGELSVEEEMRALHGPSPDLETHLATDRSSNMETQYEMRDDNSSRQDEQVLQNPPPTNNLNQTEVMGEPALTSPERAAANVLEELLAITGIGTDSTENVAATVNGDNATSNAIVNDDTIESNGATSQHLAKPLYRNFIVNDDVTASNADKVNGDIATSSSIVNVSEFTVNESIPLILDSDTGIMVPDTVHKNGKAVQEEQIVNNDKHTEAVNDTIDKDLDKERSRENHSSKNVAKVKPFNNFPPSPKKVPVPQSTPLKLRTILSSSASTLSSDTTRESSTKNCQCAKHVVIGYPPTQVVYWQVGTTPGINTTIMDFDNAGVKFLYDEGSLKNFESVLRSFKPKFLSSEKHFRVSICLSCVRWAEGELAAGLKPVNEPAKINKAKEAAKTVPKPKESKLKPPPKPSVLFRCSFCPDTMDSVAKFRRHIEESHSSGKSAKTSSSRRASTACKCRCSEHKEIYQAYASLALVTFSIKFNESDVETRAGMKYLQEAGLSEGEMPICSYCLHFGRSQNKECVCLRHSEIVGAKKEKEMARELTEADFQKMKSAGLVYGPYYPAVSVCSPCLAHAVEAIEFQHAKVEVKHDEKNSTRLTRSTRTSRKRTLSPSAETTNIYKKTYRRSTSTPVKEEEVVESLPPGHSKMMYDLYCDIPGCNARLRGYPSLVKHFKNKHTEVVPNQDTDLVSPDDRGDYEKLKLKALKMGQGLIVAVENIDTSFCTEEFYKKNRITIEISPLKREHSIATDDIIADKEMGTSDETFGSDTNAKIRKKEGDKLCQTRRQLPLLTPQQMKQILDDASKSPKTPTRNQSSSSKKSPTKSQNKRHSKKTDKNTTKQMYSLNDEIVLQDSSVDDEDINLAVTHEEVLDEKMSERKRKELEKLKIDMVPELLSPSRIGRRSGREDNDEKIKVLDKDTENKGGIEKAAFKSPQSRPITTGKDMNTVPGLISPNRTRRRSAKEDNERIKVQDKNTENKGGTQSSPITMGKDMKAKIGAIVSPQQIKITKATRSSKTTHKSTNTAAELDNTLVDLNINGARKSEVENKKNKPNDSTPRSSQVQSAKVSAINVESEVQQNYLTVPLLKRSSRRPSSEDFSGGNGENSKIRKIVGEEGTANDETFERTQRLKNLKSMLEDTLNGDPITNADQFTLVEISDIVNRALLKSFRA
jgi:hypothetical protein